MAEYVVMPKMGFNMETGLVEKWYFDEGDTVKKGEILADIETDKTIVGYESEYDGVLLKILVEEKSSVPVVSPIAIIGNAGEDISSMLAGAAQQSQDEAPAHNSVSLAFAAEQTTEAPRIPGGGQKLSPRARRYIQENGIEALPGEIIGTGFQGGVTEGDIIDFLSRNKRRVTPLAEKVAVGAGIDVSQIAGTGAFGKVTRADVESAIAFNEGGEAHAQAISTPYTGMRRIIGDRLSQSKQSAPHIYFTASVDMEAVTDFREWSNKERGMKISINDCILFFVAKALRKHPKINASLQGDEIIQYSSVNLGMAVALEEGLIVPVIRNAHALTLSELAAITKELAEKARSRKLMPDEYKGGTFTVSNLGMYGIDSFTAIINPPEAGILGISAVKWTPVAKENRRDSEIVLKPIMNMTLSVDHRLVDGASAARFMAELKALIENPMCALL